MVAPRRCQPFLARVPVGILTLAMLVACTRSPEGTAFLRAPIAEEQLCRHVTVAVEAVTGMIEDGNISRTEAQSAIAEFDDLLTDLNDNFDRLDATLGEVASAISTAVSDLVVDLE